MPAELGKPRVQPRPRALQRLGEDERLGPGGRFLLVAPIRCPRPLSAPPPRPPPGWTADGTFRTLDYASLYMCKPKRSLKRDDTKTLGHLEKAVVLELTLKHLKALTALTEQQHQKIIALQNGERSLKSPVQADLDAFHSGFQTCAKEVLQYLARFESWTPREPRCAQLVSHLHAVATQLLTPQVPQGRVPGRAPCSTGAAAAPGLDRAARCVPVIQRTQPGTEPEHDTDTDSGYGGEVEQGRAAVKQEPPGDPSPAPKRPKLEARSALLGPEPALLGSLVALGGGAPFAQPAAAPFCLPFYLLSPSAAAYVQPWLDKSGLDKYLYPAAAAPFPLLYPGIPAAAAAAAAAFPCLSSVLSPPPEKAGSAAGAPLLAHEVAPPGPLRPQHAHSRTHLPRAGNPECSQEDASLPAKDAP
ncbi:hypothetical protein ACRRTK_006181 [Alexandromys fortis]